MSKVHKQLFQIKLSELQMSLFVFRTFLYPPIIYRIRLIYLHALHMKHFTLTQNYSKLFVIQHPTQVIINFYLLSNRYRVIQPGDPQIYLFSFQAVQQNWKRLATHCRQNPAQ